MAWLSVAAGVLGALGAVLGGFAAWQVSRLQGRVLTIETARENDRKADRKAARLEIDARRDRGTSNVIAHQLEVRNVGPAHADEVWVELGRAPIWSRPDVSADAPREPFPLMAGSAVVWRLLLSGQEPETHVVTVKWKDGRGRQEKKGYVTFP